MQGTETIATAEPSAKAFVGIFIAGLLVCAGLVLTLHYVTTHG